MDSDSVTEQIWAFISVMGTVLGASSLSFTLHRALPTKWKLLGTLAAGMVLMSLSFLRPDHINPFMLLNGVVVIVVGVGLHLRKQEVTTHD